METSEVRKRVLATIERARRAAIERRTRTDEASREYKPFLDGTATPLFRQVAGALKAEGHGFQVFTPAGSVRLVSERNAEDFIELSLDTTGLMPIVVGHSSRRRGNRVIESERPVGNGVIQDLDAEQLLEYLLTELGALLER